MIQWEFEQKLQNNMEERQWEGGTVSGPGVKEMLSNARTNH